MITIFQDISPNMIVKMILADTRIKNVPVIFDLISSAVKLEIKK